MALRLRHIRLVPLAEESLGVRSMALFVETPDVRVLFDAGVSLAPRRYGLSPHPSEFKAAREARKRILEYARRADVITVSHYHRDHYTPGYTSWYEWSSPEVQEETYSGKILLIKHPTENINFNQRRRAAAFLKAVSSVAEKVLYAEESVVTFGETKIKTLGLSPHGAEGSKLGFTVIFLLETKGEKLVFAPDVQGPISERTLSLIRSSNPTIAVVGGPPLYLAGNKVPKENVERGLENLVKLAREITLIAGHHLLRDPDWRCRIPPGEARLVTYASLLNREDLLLEAYRRELYEYSPPSDEFKKWVNQRTREEPPPLE